MVTVTPTAESQLKLVCTENQYVRLEIIGGGCAGFSKHFDLTDERREDDTLVAEHLLIDSVSFEILQNATVDFIDDFIGKQWKVSIPESKNECGCGVSFSL